MSPEIVLIDPEQCKLIKKWTRHAIRDFTSPNIVQKLLGFTALYDHAALALRTAGKAPEEELTLTEMELPWSFGRGEKKSYERD